MQQPQTTALTRINQKTFLAYLKRSWRQGEHVSLLGATGTGKTTLASAILAIRQYVVVIAVKRRDETLELFRKEGYRVIRKWPPTYPLRHVIFWVKPDSLSDDMGKQSVAIHRALNDIYLSGGWCVYMDEVGYLAGSLGLGKDVGVLLNQARSNHVSVVVAMTRPASVIARIPKEALNQARHVVIFKYTNIDEIEACAKVAGITKAQMLAYQQELRRYPRGNTDALYIGKEDLFIVEP